MEEIVFLPRSLYSVLASKGVCTLDPYVGQLSGSIMCKVADNLKWVLSTTTQVLFCVL